jgi:hypothetical protein
LLRPAVMLVEHLLILVNGEEAIWLHLKNYTSG